MDISNRRKFLFMSLIDGCGVFVLSSSMFPQFHNGCQASEVQCLRGESFGRLGIVESWTCLEMTLASHTGESVVFRFLVNLRWILSTQRHPLVSAYRLHRNGM